MAACSESHGSDGPAADTGTTRPDSGDGGTEQLCYANLGAGCCGVQIGVTSGGRCPGTAIAAPDCRARAPECGDPCGQAEAPDPGTGNRIAPCFQDLGEGCCGDTVPADRCGGLCPMGSVPSSNCTSFAPMCERPCDAGGADGDALWPSVSCFVDLGDGCCGTAVDPVCGACPSGSTAMCASFAPTCDRCGGGGAAEDPAPGVPFVPPDAGADAARPPPPMLFCYLDRGAGCCGDEVAPGFGACPSGSIEQSMCRAFGEACGCDDPTDCVITSRTCCGVCGEPTLGDVVAVSSSRLMSYRDEVCSPCGGDTPECPDCASFEEPSLIATCSMATCEALDVRTLDLSACTSDDECITRTSQCCECDVLGLIAIRRDKVADYTALVCPPAGSDFDCAGCEPAPLPAAFCADDGHCRVGF